MAANLGDLGAKLRTLEVKLGPLGLGAKLGVLRAKFGGLGAKFEDLRASTRSERLNKPSLWPV